MKPLSIPRIRRLDLTQGYWHRREKIRAINRVMLAKMCQPRPMPPGDNVVFFRRPPRFGR